MNTFSLITFPFTGDPLAEKLRHLRTELAELAFTLDSRGQAEAADTALSIDRRIAELLDNEPPPFGPR
jgi:hypothetical protein